MTRAHPMSILRNLWRHAGGAAAAEFGILLPVLLALIFGATEIGRLLYQHHALTKAVNDAGHYAARLQDCTQANSNATFRTMIENLVKSGNPAGTPLLLDGWSKPGAAVVIANKAYNNAAATYRGGAVIDIVTITATLPAGTALMSVVGLDQAITFTVNHEERCIRS
jgi:Flp pilus assembly protein TadG